VIVISIIISILASIVAANRSIFVILIAAFAVGSFVSLITLGRKVKHVVNFFMQLLLLIGAGIFVYQLDILGIKTYYLSSNLYSRFDELNESLLDNSRTATWLKIIDGMYYYPFGDYQSDIGLNYAHNLWFDVAYSTGIIP